MAFFNRVSSPRRLLAAAMLAPMALGGLASSSHLVSAASGSTSANTLTIGWNIETKTLDPAGNSQNPDIWVQVEMFDRLLQVSKDGKSLQPDLATSWDISKDGKTYTFHLRPNTTFQDGSKITASDVAFDITRAAKPAAAWSWTLTEVKDVQAPDPSTVVVHLKYPWSPFLSDVSLFDTGVYPEAYFKKVGASGMAKNPIGSGPYMFDSWVRGQYVRLKKDPTYWNAAQYPMQYVEYELIPNDTTRLLNVESGQLDVDNLLADNLIPQVQHSSTAQVQINPSTETNYLAFNTKVKPFQDVKVREAISYAINRAAIIKAVLQGHGTPANSFMPAGAIDYNPANPGPSYNPTLAKKLLSESSVPHGFTMNMQTQAGLLTDQQTGVLVQSELKAIGITVNIQPTDPTTLFNNQQVGKYTFCTNLWTNDIPDPDELVSFAAGYHTSSYNFFTWYQNPMLAGLASQAEHETDAATRKSLYYQIQHIWAQDQWIIAMYYNPFVNAANNHVHGFSENPLGYFNLQGVTKS